MIVEKFINRIFSSNTYICHFEGENSSCVIDPGDSQPIIQYLRTLNKQLTAILVTHAHFDHIYGINDLLDVFPNVIIYSSALAKEGMLSAKINRSYYTDDSFIVKGKHMNIVAENDNIQLSKHTCAKIIYTPGHNHDCMSYHIGQHLFTGDALIPGIKIHTKSKFADKFQAQKTIERILVNYAPDTLICPGHGDICLLKNVKIPNFNN